MRSSCLELEERGRNKGTISKSSCLEFEERRRVGGTRMQSSCLEQLEREEGLREQGCRAVA